MFPGAAPAASSPPRKVLSDAKNLSHSAFLHPRHSEFRSPTNPSPNLHPRGGLEQHKWNLRTCRGEFAAPTPPWRALCSLWCSHTNSVQRNSGILHFPGLFTPSEEYLEFLISSTCLGVNAKMHGLSWSFSLFCGTGEGRRECPSNWAPADCYALFIEFCFLPQPRIPIFTCSGNSALLIYCSEQPAQDWIWFIPFLKNYFSSPQIIQEPLVHRIRGVTSSRGDLNLTQKPKTSQTEQAGSAK